MAEQRYQAVLAVIAEGGTVTEVAGRWGASRQTVHSWLARYEAAGLEGLADRSHRPVSCPHQMSAAVEARVLELRQVHLSWGRGGSRSSSTRRGGGAGAVGVGNLPALAAAAPARGWFPAAGG